MLKEIENYILILKELNGQFKKILDEMPEESMDWRPIQGEGDLATSSPAVLASHMAGAQIYWSKEIIGRQPCGRDRDAEFSLKGVSRAQLKAKLDAAMKIVEEFLSPLTPQNLEESRKHRERSVTVRWCIGHVIEHMGVHIGHLQLTKQLWMVKSKK